MSTLIQRQEAAIAAMLEPRTSVKRAVKLQRAVLRKFRAQSLKQGYTEQEAAQQARDVRDVFLLRVAADE